MEAGWNFWKDPLYDFHMELIQDTTRKKYSVHVSLESLRLSSSRIISDGCSKTKGQCTEAYLIITITDYLVEVTTGMIAKANL